MSAVARFALCAGALSAPLLALAAPAGAQAITFNVDGPVTTGRAPDWAIIPDIRFECEELMSGERIDIIVSHKDKSLYIDRGEARAWAGAITKSDSIYTYGSDRFGRNTPVVSLTDVEGPGWYVAADPNGWVFIRSDLSYNCQPE
jgi:hypothetical protein